MNIMELPDCEKVVYVEEGGLEEAEEVHPNSGRLQLQLHCCYRPVFFSSNFSLTRRRLLVQNNMSYRKHKTKYLCQSLKKYLL